MISPLVLHVARAYQGMEKVSCRLGRRLAPDRWVRSRRNAAGPYRGGVPGVAVVAEAVSGCFEGVWCRRCVTSLEAILMPSVAATAVSFVR
jgi:hypothetical protein